ncbi:MAG: BPSS1780 family membrane protein [Sulfuricella sp.]
MAINASNPVNAPEPRGVAAIQGWRWITAGFQLYAKSPLIWIVFFMIYMVVELVLAFAIPVVGAIGSALLDPILIAGFMAGCRALELDEEMEISHLLAGFRSSAGQLAAVGGYYLAGKMLLVMVAMGLAGIAIGPMPEVDFASLESMDPAQLELVVRHFMLVGALLMSLLIPLLMAFWFTPALVLFDRMTATQAMKTSFTACLRNIWPFSLFGVAGSLLFLLGALPFGLGLLAVIPVLFGTSVYAAYRDIFVAAGQIQDEA